jgi:hypothetical protein
MRKSFVAVQAAAAVVASAFTLGAPAATANAATAARNVPTVLLGAYVNCPSGDFCEFTSTNGNGTDCTSVSSAHPLYFSLWIGDQLCGFESFANRDGYIVRLYYNNNQRGAWVCVPNGYYNNDPSSVTFNNGSGDPGYGQSIYNNVQSGEVGSGNCSNGL